MRSIKTTSGAEIVLDGDLLAVLEALYHEVTAKKELERSFEDMNREINHLIGQLTDEERRAYLAEPLVRYRLHDRNHWYGRDFGRSYEYRRRLAVMRLVRYLLAALHYGDDLPNLAPRELKTLPAPTARHLKDYLRIVWHSNLAFLRKWKLTRALLKEFRRKKLSRGTPRLQE